MSGLQWGIAWHAPDRPDHKGQSEKPFALTRADAEGVCKMLNRQFPTLRHEPLNMMPMIGETT